MSDLPLDDAQLRVVDVLNQLFPDGMLVSSCASLSGTDTFRGIPQPAGEGPGEARRE